MVRNKDAANAEEVETLKQTASRDPGRHPHVQSRSVAGHPEAYIPGTGLAVWEIAWLHCVYEGETEKVVEHTGIDPDLVEEALAYAQTHRAEIDPAVQEMLEASVERLRTILPDIRVIDVEVGPDSSPTT